MPGEQRDRITPAVFTSMEPEHAYGRFDHAMCLCYEAEGVVSKIKAAIKRRELPRQHPATLIPLAIEEGIITRAEAELLTTAEAARADAIQVDAFDNADYFASAVSPEDVSSTTSGDGAAGGEVGFGGAASTEAGATAWSGAVVTEDPAAEPTP